MASLRHLPRAFIAPLVLLLLALAIGLAAILVPEPPVHVASKPLNLQRDGVTAMKFRAVRDEFYGVQVEMDQATARRLFPCVVNVDRSDEHCAGKSMPVELSVVLSADEDEILRRRYSARNVLGGHYGGTETFALDVDGLRLAPGRSYTLVVRSLADASSLAEARPRVVVEADTIGRMGDAIMRFLALTLAVGVGAIAGIWAGVVQVLRLRAARRLRAAA